MNDKDRSDEQPDEKTPEPPPFAPDEDLIGDLERGPDPKRPESRRIFRRDPGAEARQARRRGDST